MATTDLEKTSSQDKPGEAIDPAEEPSVGWGWHGGFPKGLQITGWFCTFAMGMMLVGNHQGILSGGDGFRAADVWLIVLTVGMAVGLLWDLRRRRLSWRNR